MAEQIVGEYKLDVNQAVNGLDKLQAEYAKTESASKKAAQTANDSFVKGSNGAKRLEAELKKQPKTLAEMELKLQRLKELLRDDTRIGTEGFRRLRTEITNTEKQLGRLNGTSKGVGQSFLNMGRQILSALGIVGGIYVVINAMKNLLGVNKEFEFQMAKVKAITGATEKDFKTLSKNAMNLGASTKFTATQVGELQEEFAKLGFTTQEIVNATEATLLLAEATGAELGEAAAVTGQVLRAFGMDASETARVTDVMASSFSKSALNMSVYAEAMKFVAPIAASANITIETTTALMAKLADAGLRGSIAGTGLKNLLSKLSDENSTLAKTVGFAVKNSNDLIRAFEVLRDKNIDLTQATELTDERSKSAFLTLIKGVDDVKELSKAFDVAKGSAERMASVMRDTLQGDTDKLSASWEALMLSINSSGIARGSVQLLTQAIDGTTRAIQRARKSADELDIQRQKSDKGYGLSVNTLTAANKLLDDYRSGNIKAGAALLQLNDVTENFAKDLQSLFDSGEITFFNTDVLKTDLKKVFAELKLAAINEMSDGLSEADFFTPEQINQALADIDRVASAANAASEAAFIRNVFFLQNAIKALKDEREKEVTTRERILAINKELIPLEEELAILLGKEAKAAKEAYAAMELRRVSMSETVPVVMSLLETLDGLHDELSRQNSILNSSPEFSKQYKDAQKAIQELKEEIKTFNDDFIDPSQGFEGISATSAGLINLEAQDENLNQGLENFIKYATAVQDITNGITNAIMASHNNELASLESQLESGQISREEYDKKRRNLERQKAIDAKNAAIFDAIIATALAVANALSVAPPLGFVLAGIAGALGAVQIGVIASQPLPAFKDGGLVKEHGLLKGKSHAQGGIKVEAEGNEYFMPTKPTLKNFGLLEAMRKGIEEQYIIRHYVPRMIDDSIFKGMNDIGKSAELNGLTANLKDHNIIRAMDRNREATVYGLKMLSAQINKKQPKRGGYA